MPFSGTLHRLLLAGAFFWVYSNPVPPLHQQAPSTEDRGCAGQCIATTTPVRVTSIRSVHLEQLAVGKSTGGTPEHETPSWTDLLENVEAGGGAGPDGRGSGPGRFAAAMQAGNEDSHGGGSGPSRAGEEPPQGEETRREPTAERAPGRRGDIMEDIPASMSTFSIVSPEPEGQVQKELAGERRDTTLENRGGEERGRGPSLSSLRPPFLGQGTEATRQSSMEPLGSPGLNRSVAALNGSLHSPLTSTPESLWAPQEEVTGPSLPDQLLPDLGPALASRQEGLETLWTEPLRPSGERTAAPPSQDVATEGTMSSEDLPLIFEPFDDVTSEGPEAAAATLAPRGSRPPAAMATGGSMPSEAELDLPVTVEDDGPSRAPPPLLQDWTSSWQTSGAEISEPISPSIGPSPSEVPDEHMKKVGGETIGGLEDTLPSSGPSPFQTPMATVTMATDQPAPKLRSGLEELESEEEPDEGEEDENTEESDEESEEDLTEAPVLPPTHPPYSLMPPPPVWVQRNQGLMRSWVEQIREKAGYVSGMLAPVGIGIAGALLIVGALYSIRMIHRKRRNSFKHQRRKVRQTEQPREPGSNRQDQAMLLADSSEDEF